MQTTLLDRVVSTITHTDAHRHLIPAVNTLRLNAHPRRHMQRFLTARTKYKTQYMCAAMAAILCTLDIWLQLGIAVGVCYTAVIWLAARDAHPRHLVMTSLTCALLILIGAYFSPAGEDVLHTVINRGLSIAAVGLITIILLNQKRNNKLQARLASIIETTDDAISAMGIDGLVTDWNRSAEKLYGYTAEEVIGTSADFTVPADLQHEQEYIAQQLERYGALNNFETERLHKDGHRIPVSITVSYMRNSNRTVVGVSALTRNISKLQELISYQEELNNNLARTNDALKRSNTELQQFAYIASHDLQAPLRRIRSFTQILQSDYSKNLDDHGKEWLQRTVDGVGEMHNLIEDLLSFSRVDSEHRPPVAVNLNDIMTKVRSLQEEKTDGATAIISADELPVISADPTQILQLFNNLISNALKYNDAETPTVHVSSQTYAGQTVLSFKDNGIGIKPEHHDRIFEIFTRLHNGQDYSGTGIGLAICRRIATKHGGNLWLESELGKGSVFYCAIPQLVRNAPLPDNSEENSVAA